MFSLFRRSTMRVLHVRLAAGVLALAAVACGGGDSTDFTATQSTTLTSVFIAPSSVPTMNVGATTTLTASAATAAGQPVSASFTWTSSDQSVATVSGGVVTAVAAGTAVITAAASGHSASVSVTVAAVVAGGIARIE